MSSVFLGADGMDEKSAVAENSSATTSAAAWVPSKNGTLPIAYKHHMDGVNDLDSIQAPKKPQTISFARCWRFHLLSPLCKARCQVDPMFGDLAEPRSFADPSLQ